MTDTPQPIAPRLCLNIGCGKAIKRPNTEERWVNVDRISLPGVDQIWDAFAYPWPLGNDVFDHIHASHLIEHVPHTTRVQPQHFIYCAGTAFGEGAVADREYQDWLSDTDGFFAFFAEVWRVLRPGGTIYCEAPYALSTGAVQDPTHTRFIVPETIAYLVAQPWPTFDYALPFRYSRAEDHLMYYAIETKLKDRPIEEVLELATHEFNALLNIGFTLRKEAMTFDGT